MFKVMLKKWSLEELHRIQKYTWEQVRRWYFIIKRFKSICYKTIHLLVT